MPRNRTPKKKTSRKKRGSRRGSRSKVVSMNNLMSPGKSSDTYDPLNLLQIGDPTKKFKGNMMSGMMPGMMPGMMSGMMSGMTPGMMNPINMPLMMPGIMQSSSIFTPTGPDPVDIKFPEQAMGQGLFTPTLTNDQMFQSGGSIMGIGNEDLDAMAFMYMQNPKAFLQTMQPAGLMSTFLEQYPYYKFAANYRHKDEADLVINKDGQRPNKALHVTAPGHNNAIPDRLAVATGINL